MVAMVTFLKHYILSFHFFPVLMGIMHVLLSSICSFQDKNRMQANYEVLPKTSMGDTPHAKFIRRNFSWGGYAREIDGGGRDGGTLCFGKSTVICALFFNPALSYHIYLEPRGRGHGPKYVPTSASACPWLGAIVPEVGGGSRPTL